MLDGRRVLVACSNDYLGLAWRHRGLAGGGGAGGSRLISGTRPLHQQLEELLGAHHGGTALLFSSGYLANLALLGTVGVAGVTVASDALNHASIIDGLRLSRASRLVVPHASTVLPAGVDWLVVEGLYSMDGDVPPLRDYPVDVGLIVDEAHAVGCLGPGGRGAAAALGRRPELLVGTLGKAYGAAGAYVVGPPDFIALLQNVGRSFVFTTAPPEPVVDLALRGLAAADDALRQQLAANVVRFRRGLAQLGWRALGQHHVVPVVVGEGAMAVSERLLARGIFVPAIRPPTVPEGTERLRFTLSAAHHDDHIDQLLEALGPRAAGP